jgi:hypothetical protein
MGRSTSGEEDTIRPGPIPHAPAITPGSDTHNVGDGQVTFGLEPAIRNGAVLPGGATPSQRTFMDFTVDGRPLLKQLPGYAGVSGSAEGGGQWRGECGRVEAFDADRVAADPFGGLA